MPLDRPRSRRLASRYPAARRCHAEADSSNADRSRPLLPECHTPKEEHDALLANEGSQDLRYPGYGSSRCAVPIDLGEGSHRLKKAEILDFVLQVHGPRRFVRLGVRESQLCPLFCRGKQGNAAAQEHGDDRDLDRVDLPDFEQPPEQNTTAEQPDVFPLFLAPVRARFPGPSRSARRRAVRSIRVSGTR